MLASGPIRVIVDEPGILPTWLTITIAFLGGGSIVSVSTYYLSSAHDRRQARAKARECLFNADDARYADTDYSEFRKRLTQLESAALIARTPQEYIRRYAYLAEVGRRQELADQTRDPTRPPRTLPLDLARLIDAQHQILIRYLWRPSIRLRINTKRTAWIVDRQINALRSAHPEWQWNFELWSEKPIDKEPGIRGWLNRSKERLNRRVKQ